MSDLNEFIERYRAVWNEPDDERRRKAVAEIWAEDAAYLSPSGDLDGQEKIAAAVPAP